MTIAQRQSGRLTPAPSCRSAADVGAGRAARREQLGLLSTLLAAWMAAMLALLAAGLPATAAADTAAENLVRRTAEDTLRTLENRRDQLDGNPSAIYDLVGNKLAPHFDFELITRSAVGRDWRNASAAQRSQLVSAFRALLISTYAKSLAKYSGEEVIYKRARAGTRAGTVVVPTEVTGSGGPPIPIDYRMHKEAGSWKVYDLVIDNVSMISSYRGQFRNIIGRSGIDGLIQELEAKAAGA
jgi:phospholipid transport system substrate-binding protein